MYNKINSAIDKFRFVLYLRFRKFRQPITWPFCRFLARFHITQSHLTLIRILILIALFFLWIYQQYITAIVLLLLNFLLDGLDGDLARFLGTDSDLGAFEDTMADSLMVIILPLALIQQGLISGLLGAYYIFITTTAWWFSVIRGTETKKTDWIFKPETTPVVHFLRIWFVTISMLLYAVWKIDIFTWVILVISILLSLYSSLDYYHIVRGRWRST